MDMYCGIRFIMELTQILFGINFRVTGICTVGYALLWSQQKFKFALISGLHGYVLWDTFYYGVNTNFIWN